MDNEKIYSKALISKIQRFSLHDGPGIRSTIFFKGCSLACEWCHNPETISPIPQLLFSERECIGCGNCALACSNKCINFINSKPKIKINECASCFTCVNVCPTSAMHINGVFMRTEDVFAEIVKDKELYQISGGGVTFSGGEPLLQACAISDIASICKANGIATAVDTAGNVPWEYFEIVLPYIDTFLFDIKLLDKESHILYTKHDNEKILKNVKYLSEIASVVVRIPIIASVNDDDKEIEKIANFLVHTNIEKVELLNYNNLYKEKYTQLGLEAKMFKSTSMNKLNAIMHIFDKFNIKNEVN